MASFNPVGFNPGFQAFQQPVAPQFGGQQFAAPMQFAPAPQMPNTSSFMAFLQTGGGSFLMSQISQPAMAAPSFGAVPGSAFPGAVPGSITGVPGVQMPSFGPVNPFQQQAAAQGMTPGAGGRLVSPFGTFITTIGPMGGNANAGFLGAQAAGQASALVLHPLNPGMIVDYANPFYSSFNFNQGFFAA